MNDRFRSYLANVLAKCLRKPFASQTPKPLPKPLAPQAPKPLTARQRLGAHGEDLAEAHLRKQDFRVIERNWRHASHELDLICTDKKELVFVEVRTRARHSMTAPRETITPKKKRHIIKAAQLYLAKNPWDGPCRFDVIAIITNDLTFELEHIRDAFDTSDSVDSRNAPW